MNRGQAHFPVSLFQSGRFGLTCYSKEIETDPIYTPAVLLPEAYSTWLDSANEDPEKLGELLGPAAPELFEAWPVSRRVNNPVNNDPQLLKAI